MNLSFAPQTIGVAVRHNGTTIGAILSPLPLSGPWTAFSLRSGYLGTYPEKACALKALLTDWSINDADSI